MAFWIAGWMFTDYLCNSARGWKGIGISLLLVALWPTLLAQYFKTKDEEDKS